MRHRHQTARGGQGGATSDVANGSQGGFGGGGAESASFEGGGGGGGYVGGSGGYISGGGGGGSFLADGTPTNADFVDLGGVRNGNGLISIDFVSSTGAVPKSSTWAMMLLGFGGLGFLGFRKSRKGDAAAMLAA